MKINLTGLVIKEKNYNDNDKLITVLSKEMGLIYVLACGVRKFLNKNRSACQIFSYSNFTLFKTKSGFLLNDAESIKNFFNIKNDIKKLSLAEYFSEIILALSPNSEESEFFLRLVLNSLFFLSKGTLNFSIIKCIMELRSCAISGYMPNLIGCHQCGNFDDSQMLFAIEKGVLACKQCVNTIGNDKIFPLKKGVIFALRHIIYSPLEKLFAFSLSSESLKELSDICEQYIQIHINYNFKALKIYKSLF